jgi:anti-sigma factor RsiW
MSCEKLGGSLIAYMDGRASLAERKSVEAHLAACGACRARTEEFRGVWTLLDELPATTPSLQFDARLRERMAKVSWSRFWLIPQPRVALSLAALVVMAVWISVRPSTIVEKSQPYAQVQSESVGTEEDFHVVKDLPVLENYDVLESFEALSALPAEKGASSRQQEQE